MYLPYSLIMRYVWYSPCLREGQIYKWRSRWPRVHNVHQGLTGVVVAGHFQNIIGPVGRYRSYGCIMLCKGDENKHISLLARWLERDNLLSLNDL